LEKSHLPKARKTDLTAESLFVALSATDRARRAGAMRRQRAQAKRHPVTANFLREPPSQQISTKKSVELE
jgi:hypothetical protein